MVDRHGRQETLDFLGYMVLYYPDFPPEDEVTAKSAFAILLRAMNTVKTRDPDRLALRDEAIKAVEEAERSHLTGDSDAVLKQLQKAWASLNRV